jgi:hypothetical protein
MEIEAAVITLDATEKEKHEHACGQRKSILPVRESSHYLPPFDLVLSDPSIQVL